MNFDENEMARLGMVFYLTMLVLAVAGIVAGTVAIAAGVSWAWLIAATSVVFIAIALPGYLWARERRKKHL